MLKRGDVVKLLAENAKDIIYRYRLKPTPGFEYVSPSATDLTGYSPEDHYADPELGLKLVHPDDKHILEAFLRSPESANKVLTLRWISRDGRVLWTEQQITRSYDDQGELVAIEGIGRNITERKRAEERLRYHAYLLENVHDAVIAIDEQLLVTAWNKGAQEMYGWRADEVLGRNLWEVVPTDLSEEQRAHALRELSERGRFRTEAMTYGKDGTPVYAEGTTIALRGEQEEEGQITGYVSIRRDITERKRAEQEIETRTHQQAVVSEIGLWALTNDDLQSLMDDTVAFVAQTLDVEYCKIVELLPSGEELLLRAGAGWEEGLVGRATEESGLGSQAGFTLLSEEPVILEDLREEERFSASTLLRDHGVVSGMSVIIWNREQPFGILGAHTKSRRTFTGYDINFLQAVANVLAAAIDRAEMQRTLDEVRGDERNRLARDLHDEALQDLTRALAETQLLQRISEDPNLNRRLERIGEALKRAGQGMHAAISDLRLEAQGREQTLAEMLESLVELTRQ